MVDRLEVSHELRCDPAAISAETKIGLGTEETGYGRGGFRTCDLSRVKRALSH
jgi:hypothetical protein